MKLLFLATLRNIVYQILPEYVGLFIFTVVCPQGHGPLARMLAEKTLGKINLKLQGNLWRQVLGKRLREHCIAVDIAAHKNVCIPRKTIPYPNKWFSSMIIE